jgi:hypothetical protein
VRRHSVPVIAAVLAAIVGSVARSRPIPRTAWQDAARKRAAFQSELFGCFGAYLLVCAQERIAITGARQGADLPQ